jgi:hypothetical protein
MAEDKTMKRDDWTMIRLSARTAERLKRLAELMAGWDRQKGKCVRRGRRKLVPLDLAVERLLDHYGDLR